MRREWRYPEGRPSYEVVVACEAVGDEADRSAVLADVTRLMTPAPQRQIEGWLAELSVLVARRPQDEVDEAIRLTAYAGRLAQYPADVARSALLDTRWQFWPTWAELAAVCDGLTSPRRHMLLALSAPVEPPIARRLVPEEERRRIHDMGKVYDAQPRAADLNDDAPVFPHWSTRVDHTTAAEQIRRARAKAGNLAPSDRETEEFEAVLARSREIRGRMA